MTRNNPFAHLGRLLTMALGLAAVAYYFWWELS